jgi:hypothetical protein
MWSTWLRRLGVYVDCVGECDRLPSTCLHLTAMTEGRRGDMFTSFLLGVVYVYLGLTMPPILNHSDDVLLSLSYVVPAPLSSLS